MEVPIRWAARAPHIREWLSKRHSVRVEIVAIVVLYALYEIGRGLTVGDPATALANAHAIRDLEQGLGIFVERDVQRMVDTFPSVIDGLGALYLTMHLGVTTIFLVWLYLRSPREFPIVRTTLLIATAISVVIFSLYPAAPPRLAGIGIVDTVSGGHVDLNHGLVNSLYNPYAAIPSLHFGYALVVGVVVYRFASSTVMRIAGALYPGLVLLTIVATGNHFVLDAVAGALVVGAAFAVACALRSSTTHAGHAPADNNDDVFVRAGS